MTKFRRSIPIIALAITVLYLIALVIGNTTLLGIMWLILAALLSLLTLAVGAMAGAVVVKSLFAVAAELSLLIFLTQAFCAAPGRAHANDVAMTILFTVGTLYITYLFLSTLWEKLKEVYQRRFEEHPRSWEKVLTVSAFVAFVGLFVWELYLIVAPIVAGMCVYK